MSIKLIFFDVETTGLDPKNCAIHQLAGIITIDGEEKHRFSFRIKPHDGAEINENALQIGGLTKQMLSLYTNQHDQHTAFVSLLSKFVDRYDKADKFYLAGYNSRSFDEQFLRAWFDRNGGFYGAFFWQIGFDVMVLAAEYLKNELPDLPNFKLSTVAAHLGINVEEKRLHDAMYDVELTRSIYLAIQSRPDASQLARKVVSTLDQQQRFYKASRHDAKGKDEALALSKSMEKELRQMCADILTPTQPQQMLF